MITAFRRRIFNYLIRFSLDHEFKMLAAALLRAASLRGKGKWRILPIADYCHSNWADNREELLPPAKGTVSLQVEVGEKAPKIAVEIPSLGVTRIESATVRIDCCAITSKQLIFLNEPFMDRPANALFNGGHLIAHGANWGIVSVSDSEQLESGIWLGGLGSSNWYHWMLEILPKVLVLDRIRNLDGIPLLVPPEIETVSQFEESLRILASDHQWIPLRRETTYLVRELLMVDPPSWIPFNQLPGSRIGHEVSYFREDVIRDLVQRISDALSHLSGVRRGNYFLVREPERRPYNQEEILSIATEFDFSPINPAKLSLADQVGLFCNAQAIIGPSGAAWTGLLFASSTLRCLIWGPRQASDFISFSTLAGLNDVNLRYVYTDIETSKPGGFYDMPYTLDPRGFRAALSRMFQDKRHRD